MKVPSGNTLPKKHVVYVHLKYYKTPIKCTFGERYIKISTTCVFWGLYYVFSITYTSTIMKGKKKALWIKCQPDIWAEIFILSQIAPYKWRHEMCIMCFKHNLELSVLQTI